MIELDLPLGIRLIWLKSPRLGIYRYPRCAGLTCLWLTIELNWYATNRRGQNALRYNNRTLFSVH